jgi:hypothetical protein
MQLYSDNPLTFCLNFAHFKRKHVPTEEKHELCGYQTSCWLGVQVFVYILQIDELNIAFLWPEDMAYCSATFRHCPTGIMSSK